MKDPAGPRDRFLDRLARIERELRDIRAALTRTSVPSEARPDAAAVGAGTSYYDRDLQRPIWSDGAAWRYSDGTPV